MSGLSQGGIRDVRINFGEYVTDAIVVPAAPVNFYKAVLYFVNENEVNYKENPTAITDLSAVDVLLTGNNPNELFKATVTVDISEGLYTVEYVGTFQTVEEANA